MATASQSLFNMTVASDNAGGNQGLLMPKLQFRYRVNFLNFGIDTSSVLNLTKQVMQCARPNLTFADITLNVYNSTLYLPGKPTWATLAITIRDDASGSVSKAVGQQMQKQFDFVEQASAPTGADFKFQTNIEILDGGNGTAIPVVLESVSDPNTRDILKVTVKVGSEDFNLFVNHWPSRRGGQDESEMHRIRAASVLRKEVDQILSVNPKANIICMGDFNDFPTNKSVHDVLQAGVSNEHSVLFNMMSDFEALKKGTHFYKGEWSPLDQFMLSYGMFDNKCASANAFEVVSYDFLFYTSKDGVKSPARAYVGDSYKGGYSDHLPILMHVN